MITVSGTLLQRGNEFVCWNQYSAEWFMGPRRLSEIFCWSRAHHLFNETSSRFEAARKAILGTRLVDIEA